MDQIENTPVIETVAPPAVTFTLAPDAVASAIALATEQAAAKEVEKAAKKDADKAKKEAEKLENVAKKDAEKAERKAAKKVESDAKKAAAKAERDIAKPKAAQFVQNDVARPNPETQCGKVWAIADAASEQISAPVALPVLLILTAAEGLNEGNVKTAYSRWRKFNGVSGRTVAANVDVPAAA